MNDGRLRGALSSRATQRQMDVLAACAAAGGSMQVAADLVGIRPSTAKRHLADLRARSGLTTVELIYSGRAAGWLVVLSLEPQRRGPLWRCIPTSGELEYLVAPSCIAASVAVWGAANKAASGLSAAVRRAAAAIP